MRKRAHDLYEEQLGARALEKLRIYAEDSVAVRMERAEAAALVQRVETITLALRRIVSQEAFTTALDLTHPSHVKTEAVIAELYARMRHALEAVDG